MMPGRRTDLAVARRLNALARVYANVFRPERYDEDFMELEYSMSSRQAFEILRSAFRRNYVEEIGEKASLRVLQSAMRPYLVHKYALRTGVLSCIPVLVYAHGVSTGILLQTVIYLSTRPLAWKNRGRGARLAEGILQHRREIPGGRRGLRRALHSELSHIPARALHSQRWREHLEALLPREEAVRDIAVKLADQYEGSLKELAETSRALAR